MRNSPRELSEERETRQAATATEEQLFWLRRSSRLPNMLEPTVERRPRLGRFTIPLPPRHLLTSLQRDEPVWDPRPYKTLPAYAFHSLRPLKETLFISTVRHIDLISWDKCAPWVSTQKQKHHRQKTTTRRFHTPTSQSGFSTFSRSKSICFSVADVARLIPKLKRK